MGKLIPLSQKSQINKKGQVGMETVKAVILAFLIIGVLAIAVILTLVSVRDVADKIDITTGSINETKVIPNTLAGNDTSVGSYRGVTLSSITVSNNSNGEVVPTTNYTITGGTIFAVAGGKYNNTLVRIQASYSYPTPNTQNVVQNITGATTTFFGNTGTIFSILAVVVIVLAIAIIIYAVSRFGGGGSGSDI